MRENSSGERRRIGEEIHVWHAWLDRDAASLPNLASTLSQDEIARANRFHFERDKNHYVMARGLLRELLRRYLAEAPGRVEFSYGEFGKPALAGVHASSGLSFNVSHSGGLAVYAFAENRNLGIDVEQIKADFVSEDIARRYFSARELHDLLSLPPEKRAEAFFHCWTRKEAYLKARGAGLKIPLDSFSVSLLPGQPVELVAGTEAGWQLTALQLGIGFAGALAYDGASCPVRLLGSC